MAKFNPKEWIAVFRAGDYGWKGKYNAEDLAEMADQYDPQYRKAPALLGHPPWPEIKGEVPAHGWVSKLRAVAGVLYAKFEELSQDFIDGINSGKYKGRSIGFMPKKYSQSGEHELWHVAFLGGSTPHAVRLLPTFSDEEVEHLITLDYMDSQGPQAETLDKGEAQEDNQSDQFNPRSDNSSTGDRNMSEEKLKELETRLADREKRLHELSKRADVTPEQVEQLKANAAKAAELQAQLDDRDKSDAEKEVASLCEGIPPAVATDDLKGALLHLKLEGGEHYAAFAGLLQTLKTKFDYVFGETAPQKAAAVVSITNNYENADEESVDLDSRARALMAADRNLSYKQAVMQAAAEGGDR